MAKSIKLNELVLLRVVAEVNHQEYFYGSMLGMETIIENNSVLLNSFKNNYFSEQNMDQLQVFNKGSIGTLDDYGSHLENDLVELLNLNDFSDIINNGGVLLVISENFDSIEDAFIIEDDKILAITGEGEIKHLILNDTDTVIEDETKEERAEEAEDLWNAFD